MILKSGIPVITVSYAQSVDGRIATATGDSRWISGPETLTFAHELRRDHDAILAGIGTVLRDDPELSCRLPGVETSPRRIVLDSRLRIPLDSRIVETARNIRTIVVTLPETDGEKRRTLEARGVEILTVEASGGTERPALEDVLRELGARGIRSIFVEGGSRVITSFLSEGLVDRLLIVTAPMLIGKGIEAIGDLGIRNLSDAIIPASSNFRALGKDLVWELDLIRKPVEAAG